MLERGRRLGEMPRGVQFARQLELRSLGQALAGIDADELLEQRRRRPQVAIGHTLTDPRSQVGQLVHPGFVMGDLLGGSGVHAGDPAELCLSPGGRVRHGGGKRPALIPPLEQRQHIELVPGKRPNQQHEHGSRESDGIPHQVRPVGDVARSTQARRDDVVPEDDLQPDHDQGRNLEEPDDPEPVHHRDMAAGKQHQIRGRDRRDRS